MQTKGDETMEKKVFILPEVEVVRFNEADILTDSTGGGAGPGIQLPDDDF